MLEIVLIVLLVVLTIAVLGVVAAIRAFLRPRPADPKIRADCALPSPPTGESLPTRTDPPTPPLDSSITGGFQKGPQVNLPRGAVINLLDSLVVVSAGDLIIDGEILAATQRTIDISLVSLDGNVIIGPRARIGFGQGRLGSNTTVSRRYALSRGDTGGNGGNVRLLAPRGQISIEGTIQAQDGGFAGSTTATGLGFLRVFGGLAVVIGGQSGAGGDVGLCALQVIRVAPGASVAGGDGGLGEAVTANAANGSRAYAVGGPGNDAGDVSFTGLGEDACLVIIDGRATGGNGGLGGIAFANGGAGAFDGGGTGTALGGDAGDGGTVLFSNCTVQRFNRVVAGIGGDGGPAFAGGGVGANGGLFGGSDGGDAEAAGGDGGEPGDLPAIPTPAGIQLGQQVPPGGRPSGKGGDADATPGNGGTGGTFGSGGSSGTGGARGGTSGNTGTQPGRVTTAAVAAAAGRGTVGGLGVTATSAGAP